MPITPLPRRTALRYVQPLREGGSLPAVVDTDDGMYVVKFRGAGQGARALIAELVVGRLAAVLGLPTPEPALVEVLPTFGRGEPDPEIQDLLRGSHGTNVGLRYLDGAFNFALAAASEFIDADFAARVVWLDAFVLNPDRTHRNTNLLIHERKPWLIDHGAALYVHHDWDSATEQRARAPFPLIRDHVLLSLAEDLEGADEACAALLTGAALHDALDAVPDDLLLDPLSADFATAGEARQRYVEFLSARLQGRRAFVADAIVARTMLQAQPPARKAARR
jgi:hypothetical protein